MNPWTDEEWAEIANVARDRYGLDAAEYVRRILARELQLLEWAIDSEHGDYDDPKQRALPTLPPLKE